MPGNIYFHENIGHGSRCFNEEASVLLQQADICLMIGVLQYIDLYSGLLKGISEPGVEHIFITRTMITNIVNTFLRDIMEQRMRENIEIWFWAMR